MLFNYNLCNQLNVNILNYKLEELLICNPKDINDFHEDFDLILFRNTGPAANFEKEYKIFRDKIKTHNLLTYNVKLE